MKKVLFMCALIMGLVMSQTTLAGNNKKQVKHQEAVEAVEAEAVEPDEPAEPTEASEPEDEFSEVEDGNTEGYDGQMYDQYDVQMARIQAEQDKNADDATYHRFLINMIESVMAISGICVLLPIVIVLIVFMYKHKKNKARNLLISQMIEKNMDVSAFIKAEKAQKHSTSKAARLWIPGLIFTFLGLGFFIIIGLGFFMKTPLISPNDTDAVFLAIILFTIGFALIVGALTLKHFQGKEVGEEK